MGGRAPCPIQTNNLLITNKVHLLTELKGLLWGRQRYEWNSTDVLCAKGMWKETMQHLLQNQFFRVQSPSSICQSTEGVIESNLLYTPANLIGSLIKWSRVLFNIDNFQYCMFSWTNFRLFGAPFPFVAIVYQDTSCFSRPLFFCWKHLFSILKGVRHKDTIHISK